MERYFKTEQGLYVNIIDHTLEQIDAHPHLTIRIATDSQNTAGHSKYATAIVYRYGTRGAHYIYLYEEIKRIKDNYSRLYEEAVRTIAAADLITSDIPVSIEALEFDYNEIRKTLSTPLISGVKGWAMGLGYNPVFKGGQMIASKAADHLCRK